MSSSETESEPELATDSVTTMAAYAQVSTRKSRQEDTHLKTVSWVVDTLASLDFRVVRKDASLHGYLKQQELLSDGVRSIISDVASIFKPSFLHLLFQYRRLFHMLAVKDLSPGSAPPAVVCWVDVVLAKLGDVSAVVAAGFHKNHPDQMLPDVLRAQRQEDNLRAAIQLPDNWDMVPSTLSSERASPAAKRLSLRLMMGQYILYPALSGGQRTVDSTIQPLLSTFSDFHLIQQERLTSAMAVSLFAKPNVAPDAGFRPHTMAAVMHLLRSALHGPEYPTRTSALSPLEQLDALASIDHTMGGCSPNGLGAFGRNIRACTADTIVRLTTTYMQHHKSGSETPLDAIDLMPVDCSSSSSAYKGAVIGVMIELVFRFIVLLAPALSSRPQLSANMLDVLYETCKFISQWMDSNACGVQSSTECCKALVIIFCYLSQNEQFLAVNDLVIGSLALMGESCIRVGWKAAQEDTNFGFLEALKQAFAQAKRRLSQNDVDQPGVTLAEQLTQFLVIRDL
ncbi:hypothetical protein BU15DRAFT_73766 [Melanogaster broomeanus]|nr:hypothetical protein BU15DRAFT_73766 [Melanogaster broomeanus]